MASFLPKEGAGSAYIIGLTYDLDARLWGGAQPLCNARHVLHKLRGITQSPKTEEAKKMVTSELHFSPRFLTLPLSHAYNIT